MQKLPATPGTLPEYAQLLRAGGLVAIPTETVYGLAADASNSEAVLSIYETKGRPRFNPLIVHCASLDMAETLAEFSPLARQLAAFWPGPLTLVLPRRPDAPLSPLVTAGLDTVAIRVPGHKLALELIELVGRPLAAPSANPSGRLSPTTAGQVVEGFGGRVPVLDGGPCPAGVESTILRVAGEAVVQLRAGALPRAEIEALIGREVSDPAAGGPVLAPGMLSSHYAPHARVRLGAAAPGPGEAYLAFGHCSLDAGGPVRNLSPAGDLREAARNLFSMLRELDASGAQTIAVAPIPSTGLGEAINDRLLRAAAPR
ncbi:MAG TPA: L-threonylcarbamoyladenylate synthase [Devosia sp.]|nr:L-threonylcarbamoyladenylate synthase [Devosia sp.]